jgi:predicted transporter
MRKVIGLFIVGILSVIVGLAIWLTGVWALSLVADRISNPELEVTLALLSPLLFGFLVVALLALIIFFAGVYLVKKRKVSWLGFASNSPLHTDATRP